MSTVNFTPRPEVTPTIYAYEYIGVDSHKGYLKIGYTDRDAATRVKEQNSQGRVPYKIVLEASAMRTDGTAFNDHDIHRYMRRRGFKQLNAGEDKNEWYKCTVNDVKAAIVAVRNRIENDENRTLSFPMRPEQAYAVKSTMAYYEKAQKSDPTRAPKFLWNCKMRFGKTFATYQLAKKMGLKRVLVLTFKPAVESAWADDLMSHIDFEGWQFISNKDAHNRSVNINDAFDAADRKSRNVWAGLLVGSAIFLLLPWLGWAMLGIPMIAGLVITGIYWLDVRPQIKDIMSNAQGNY